MNFFKFETSALRPGSNLAKNLRYMKWNESHNKFMLSSFVDDWLQDEKMRTYDKLDFLPMQKAPKNVYNTFTGSEADTKKLYDVDINDSLIIKHKVTELSEWEKLDLGLKAE